MAVVPMPVFLSQPLSRSRKRVIMMVGAGIPSMRYFNPRSTGSEKPPKPKRRFAAWSATSLIVAVMFLTAGNAGAQQSSAVDTAAATRHLFEAVHGNSMAAVQSSIAAGADISATNEWGVTAIDLAVDKGYFSIAHFLLSVRNLRRLEEKPKPSPIPPAAIAATESQPVLPPVKPWAATVEPSPKVSRQTAPTGTEAPGDAKSQTAQTPAPDHIPSVAATTQSRTDGKPDPFDPSTAYPADDLPIIGKIRRRSKIPEATAPSPPPASKGFQLPTANRTEPAEGAAPEASPPESAVPGASEAVKPSAMSRFADTVSGFFRGKEEAGETAPAGGQPIPETETRVDQPKPPAPTAAPEGENKSRAGPVSAIPETPAPLASSEDSVAAQEDDLDYKAAAPADEEPEENFLLAGISKRITDLFATREEEKTVAEEAAEETAFPSQSETDFKSVRSESEAEPTPQATGETATGESAGIAIEQQAKKPPAPIETATLSALESLAPVETATLIVPEPEPLAPAPEAAPEGEDTSRAGPASAIPETPAAGKKPAKSPATNADEAAEETAAKSAAPESRPAKTAAMAKTIQKPSPAEETVKPRGFIEKMAKYFRPDGQDKAQRQAPKAEPDVDVHVDEWSVSDVQTARVPPSRRRVKASPVPQNTRYLTGKSLAIGQSVRLGSPPRGVTAIGRKTCIEKRGGALLFCVIPVDWPSIIDPYFQVGSIMYQGSKAVARYDNGAATNFHALFPAGSYEAIIQYFTNRYGQPTKTLMRSIAPLAAPRRENPTALWQSIDTATKQISTLEVRKFDDGRGGFPDTKRGVVMLYQQWSSPIFPHVSMIELMLLDRQG